MGLFSKKSKNIEAESNINDGLSAEELLKKHKGGELSDTVFLRAFGGKTVYYSTPFGDCKDGTKKLFVLPAPEGTGYNPVFTSEERLAEFYEKTGRAAYLITSAAFAAFLETARKINDGDTPLKLGAVIDPGHYGVAIDATALAAAIDMIKG